MFLDPLIPPDACAHLPEGTVVLDVRPREAYLQGHLPGARWVDLEGHLSTAGEPGFNPALGGRHPLPSIAGFAAQLGRWGVRRETPVVALDGQSGGNGAARLWWMLRAIGHPAVAVVDGGFEALRRAAVPMVAAEPDPVALPPYPASGWILPQADLPEVALALEDPGRLVLDVRAAERWRGEVEPFDPIPGRLPGSRNLDWRASLGSDGRFLPTGQLRAQFATALGALPPDRVIVHCGSGVTACTTLLAMAAAGLDGAAVYMGSYSEWCRNRPVSRG